MLESPLHILEDALEDRLPVTIYRVPVPSPCPIREQMPEEAPLWMRLYAENISVAVAQRGDVEGRPARVPRVARVGPAVVDEPEDDLVVVNELPQHLLLPVFRQQEFSFRVRGYERNDAALFQAAREDARSAVFQPQEAGTALVMARIIRREDRLRHVRHHAVQGREEARLHQDLEPVADAEEGLARLHEGDEIFRKLRSEPGREDRARADVVPRREAARDHEDVIIVEVPP